MNEKQKIASDIETHESIVSEIECDKCTTIGHVYDVLLDEEVAEILVEDLGWGVKNNKILCPNCNSD